MSEEKINQELSDDELKDVAGGASTRIRVGQIKTNNLAAPFVPGGAVLSAEEGEVKKRIGSDDASSRPALGLPIDPNI